MNDSSFSLSASPAIRVLSISDISALQKTHHKDWEIFCPVDPYPGDFSALLVSSFFSGFCPADAVPATFTLMRMATLL
jgi:hypothetical protein